MRRVELQEFLFHSWNARQQWRKLEIRSCVSTVERSWDEARQALGRELEHEPRSPGSDSPPVSVAPKAKQTPYPQARYRSATPCSPQRHDLIITCPDPQTMPCVSNRTDKDEITDGQDPKKTNPPRGKCSTSFNLYLFFFSSSFITIYLGL